MRSKKIDVHYNTDETFLLMVGQAILIAAEMLLNRLSFEVINMHPKVLYHIPKCCWHNIALSTDAEVSITEDTIKHLGDYDFYYLSEEQQAELSNLIDSDWVKHVFLKNSTFILQIKNSGFN